MHGDALNALRAEIAEEPDPTAAAQRAVEMLHDRFGNYDWVGIYWVDGNDLVLHVVPMGMLWTQTRPVPEPGVLSMLLTAVGWTGWLRRRRRRLLDRSADTRRT